MRHSKSQPLAMILLAVVALLQLPTVAESLRTHLAEILTLKCDSLPHRSIFINNRCYFAVFEEVEKRNASARCSSVLQGAKVTVDIPVVILERMMVDKSQFELGRDSKFRNFLCVAETGYKCDAQGAILTSGRCFTRGSRTMNFANANKYCKTLEMEIPAPTNDFDNRIIRDVLVKGPAWAQKSLMEGNGFKWSQVNDYSRWTTCNRDTAAPRLYAGSYNTLLSCKQDTAGAIDKYGYWSKCGVNYVLDVVCVKNADNYFTKGTSCVVQNRVRNAGCRLFTSHTLSPVRWTSEYSSVTATTTIATTTTAAKKIPCNYHGDPIKLQSVQTLTALPAWKPGDKNVSTTCYTSILSSTRYNIMAKATVETQRGCEVLCDTKEQCVGFSFKDAGFSSECILHSATTDQICESTIFLKKTVGCVARTNVTAEFGNDPCIDERVDSALATKDSLGNIGGYPFICQHTEPFPLENKIYILRVIDFNGRRITLDYRFRNSYLAPYEGMWMYRWYINEAPYIPIVAATCTRAEDKKCPCAPLKLLSHWNGRAIPKATPVAVKNNGVNPCKYNDGYYFICEMATSSTPSNGKATDDATFTCRAGRWFMHCAGPRWYFIVTAAACQRHYEFG